LLDLSEVDLNEIKLYQKRSPQRPWSAVESSFNAQTREIYLLQSAEAQIAPFLNDDVTPPLIELTADGRPLRESGSGLVAQNPSLYLIIEDESGINLDPENLTIRLNGAALPDDKIFVPDSLQRNNSLGITLFPELQNGTYQLEVEGEDVNGNKALGVFQLVVSDEFDLRVYGNYPNPFKDQTIFSYFVNLNDDLDEFEIRIYTVSGRLIRRIDSDINNPIGAIDGGARRKGYNELIWDGRDRRGNEVANGVYFAILRARYEDQVIERTIKVAKLR
ncbi:MAG TPA: hypothetical protein PLG66_07715, partial [Calditrichia bacterium]|nr:hypothetical protein [Calditrichia bacterium]